MDGIILVILGAGRPSTETKQLCPRPWDKSVPELESEGRNLGLQPWIQTRGHVNLRSLFP